MTDMRTSTWLTDSGGFHCYLFITMPPNLSPLDIRVYATKNPLRPVRRTSILNFVGSILTLLHQEVMCTHYTTLGPEQTLAHQKLRPLDIELILSITTDCLLLLKYVPVNPSYFSSLSSIIERLTIPKATLRSINSTSTALLSSMKMDHSSLCRVVFLIDTVSKIIMFKSFAT